MKKYILAFFCFAGAAVGQTNLPVTEAFLPSTWHPGSFKSFADYAPTFRDQCAALGGATDDLTVARFQAGAPVIGGVVSIQVSNRTMQVFTCDYADFWTGQNAAYCYAANGNLRDAYYAAQTYSKTLPTGATKDGVLIDIGNIAKAWAIGSEPQPNTQPVVTPIYAPLVTQ